MDKNRVMTYVAAMVIVLTILFGNLDLASQAVILLLALATILWARRAYFFFIKANRIYSAKDRARYPEAMAWYARTLKAGISPKYTVLAATILIQEGHASEGRWALEKLVTSRSVKDEAILGQAKSALSLAFYIDRDYERALSLCEEVMKTKYRDNVLYINICTYYLALGRVKDFRRTVREFSQSRVTSPALLDLQIVYEMLGGNWKGAYVMLRTLFDKASSFGFADPYVHMAQVWMHYGRSDEAVKMLDEALEKVSFRPVTIISKDFIQNLRDALCAESTRVQTMADCDSDPVSVINGWMPAHAPEGHRFAPQEELEMAEQAALESPGEVDADLDDKEPDTELNADDEEWLRRHQGS